MLSFACHCNRILNIIFEEIQPNDSVSRPWTLIIDLLWMPGSSTIVPGFSAAEVRQFFLLTNALRWNWTSLKMTFCEKSSSACLCSSTQLTSVPYFKWSSGFSYCVNWTLYTCRAKSFVKFRCNVVVERFNSFSPWRMYMIGCSITVSLSAAMF